MGRYGQGVVSESGGASGSSTPYLVIGCYTLGHGGMGAGLVVVERDQATGELWLAGPTQATQSPSFVVRHPTRPVLYAVNELVEGAVSAFGMDGGGNLRHWGTWPTGGADPCHLAVSPDGRRLVVANYAVDVGRGGVAAFALDEEGRPTGRTDLVEHDGCGPDPVRQRNAHAHEVVATNDAVTAVDLGMDTVLRYWPDPTTGKLGTGHRLVTLPPGTGPRHFTTGPDGTIYLVGELAGTVTVLQPGEREWVERATVPSRAEAGSGNAPSEVAVTADGRWLYVANRGPSTIAVFSLQEGTPRFVGEVPTGGVWPRHFLLIDDFLYVANERSHTVTVLRIDPDTGLPAPAADVFASPSPTCLLPLRF